MKILILLSLLFVGSAFAEESPIRKFDRTAQEAVDEAKSGAKKVIKKLQNNTNSDKSESKDDDSKKKD